jgi:hypothetical protein
LENSQPNVNLKMEPIERAGLVLINKKEINEF